jgi:hypothetical protein
MNRTADSDQLIFTCAHLSAAGWRWDYASFFPPENVDMIGRDAAAEQTSQEIP